MHISKLTEDQFKKLPFIEGSFLLFRGSSENTQVLHKLSQDNFDKINKLFNKDSDPNTIKAGSKVFLAPNCSFKIPVIKEVCKKKNLKLVTDVNKADLIISNGNLSESSGYNESHRMNSYMLNRVYFSEYVPSQFSNRGLNQFLEDSRVQLSCFAFIDEIKSFELENVRFNILGHGPLIMYNYNHDTEREANVITDDCLEVVYNILKRSLPIVQDKTLFNSIEKVVIDKDYYETIKMMLKGSDEDTALAFEILYNCDINKSYYYLIKLLDENHYAFHYRKGKNTKFHKAFMRELGCSQDYPEAFLNQLIERGCITEEIYDDLTKTILKKAITSFDYHNDLKLFNIEVKTKTFEEYMSQVSSLKEENV